MPLEHVVPQDAQAPDAAHDSLDAVIIGAGMSGIYMLHKLRDELGLNVRAIDRARGVGGTWYWNRYPGARCDSESLIYCYTFSEELQRDWEWTERYPAQPEILAYLEHVVDRFDLLRNIQLATTVTSAEFDDAASEWVVETDRGDTFHATYLITAVGVLTSAPITPDFLGLASFAGEVYNTTAWPHEQISFSGKRVGIIGTGSSGVQASPVIAAEAERLTVFQRTPNYIMPARNHPLSSEQRAKLKASAQEVNEFKKWSDAGFQYGRGAEKATEATDERRREVYDQLWADGGHKFVFGGFQDLLVDQAANDTAADYIRERYRERVHDPELARRLSPTNHPFGTKRPIIDTGYLEMFNLPHVDLVDLGETPIVEITPTGIRTTDGDIPLDIIVLAIGFDAVSGPLTRIPIRSTRGQTMAELWRDGPKTYLGLGVAGYPNLFTIAGPGSPAALTNMPVAIEHHVEWIANCIQNLRAQGTTRIEVDEAAQEKWAQHLEKKAGRTLYPKGNSWYRGANVPGKSNVFTVYVGSFGSYRKTVESVAEHGYEGFVLDGLRVDSGSVT